MQLLTGQGHRFYGLAGPNAAHWYIKNPNLSSISDIRTCRLSRSGTNTAKSPEEEDELEALGCSRERTKSNPSRQTRFSGGLQRKEPRIENKKALVSRTTLTTRRPENLRSLTSWPEPRHITNAALPEQIMQIQKGALTSSFRHRRSPPH